MKLPLASPRPVSKSLLGGALARYAVCKGDDYDAEFARLIRERQPDWFIDSRRAAKQAVLLAMPPGVSKPEKKSPLGIMLRHYTGKADRSYDAVFDAAIRAAQPQWFAPGRLGKKDTAGIHKANLLAFAPGAGRPHGAPLQNALSRFINRGYGSYDAEFDRLIRERQPQWFRKPRVKR